MSCGSSSLLAAIVLATGYCHAETVSVEATVCDEEGGNGTRGPTSSLILNLGARGFRSRV